MYDACSKCKYWMPSLESYCSISPGTLSPSDMHKCMPLIKKINTIYLNRFIKEHHIKDKQLISNCKKVLAITDCVLLDVLIYMTDKRGKFIEFLWQKKDIEDSGFSIKIYKDEIYIQIYQMEKTRIHRYETFGTSLHVNMKEFKKKQQIINNVLWSSMAAYLLVHTDVRNANQEIQDIFKSKVKKDK